MFQALAEEQAQAGYEEESPADEPTPAEAGFSYSASEPPPETPAATESGEVC